MRRPKHEIEASVPSRGTPAQPGQPDSRPQIRRQLERICESLGLEYDDLLELHVVNESVNAILYDRTAEGELYRDEFNRVATRQVTIPVDLVSFLGDERDR